MEWRNIVEEADRQGERDSKEWRPGNIGDEGWPWKSLEYSKEIDRGFVVILTCTAASCVATNSGTVH